MSPRPILKRSVSTDPHQQQYIHHHVHHQFNHNHNHHTHGVHFPPSPSLTRTFTAYSSAAYDRSPIVVSPNTCALPERGCPGRTYLLDEQVSPSPRGIAYARDYHPRALAFASYASANGSYAPVPPLVPDLSSESDESDGFYSIPGECTTATGTSQQSYGIHGLAGPSGNGSGSARYSNSNSMYSNGNNNNIYNNNGDGSSGNNNNNGYTPCDDEDSDTLGFLPYGPSSPSTYAYANAHYPSSPSSGGGGGGVHFTSEGSDTTSPHKHRRKRSSDRRHESSTDPDRIPGGGGPAVDPSSLALGFGALSISPSATRKRTTSPARKKGVRRAGGGSSMMMQLHQQQQQPFGFGASDDGCLGGF